MSQSSQVPHGPGYGVTDDGAVAHGHTPAPPTKKPVYKRKWFIVLAALLVMGVFASQQDGGSETAAPDAGSDQASQADVGREVEDGSQAEVDDAAAADDGGAVEEDTGASIGLGEPAEDGKFRFVVDAVDCSTTQIGNDTFGTTAQGKFCILDVTISNIGNEPQTFFGDNAILRNAQGQEFSASSEAAIYLEDSESLYSEINPGNTLKSRVVFDVPAGMKPASVELHDSAFSGGVTVDLE